MRRSAPMPSSSLQLARLFGIRIGVNGSWFLVVFLFIFVFSDSFGDVLADDGQAYVAAVLATVLFFASILLHELGHALAARHSGIEVESIDLFFFGGVMRMSRDTDRPWTEFKVAVAGPLVTAGIVALGTLAGIGLTGRSDFWDQAWLRSGAQAGVAELLLSVLVTMNALLLVFNLVPAFPLDGGRIARAAAWKLTGDRIKATRIAAWLGQAFALLLIGYGAYLLLEGEAFDGVWLVVLGWMLGQSARSAVSQTRFSERLRGVTVADIMDAEPVTIPAELPADRAYDEFFLRYRGWKWFAVTDDHGRLVGVAHVGPIQEAAGGRNAQEPVRRLVAPRRSEGEVAADASLESLLGSEGLRRRGALIAVDDDGRLRGVVTLDHVTRALQAHLAT
jgi:Zn-dependent protease